MSVAQAVPDFTDADYPADPYPGGRPPSSFLHRNAAGYTLVPGAIGWRVGNRTGRDLDEELAGLDAAPLRERLPVLAYGSNANPSKITWIREHLGLTGPAVVIRAKCWDISAVWSAGVRQRDGQRPAVVASSPGTLETHAIWLVTPDQRRVLDRVEGRGERYRLAWVHTPVQLEGGRTLTSVLAYIARPEAVGKDVAIHLNRAPLLVGGELIRCADTDQSVALTLDGIAAETDGLNATEVHGEP